MVPESASSESAVRWANPAGLILLVFLLLALSACGSLDPASGPTPPGSQLEFSITAFSAVATGPAVSGEPLDVRFTWNISADRDLQLVCSLDPGDGSTPFASRDKCSGTHMESYTYVSFSSTHVPQLTVADQYGRKATRTTNVEAGSNPAPPPPGNPAPPPPPLPPNDPPSANPLLELVNEARSQPQQCGDTHMPAAPPLAWDDRLESAAQLHSEFMAETDHMTHVGRNGSSFTDRISTQGYQWNRAGENVAAGYPSYASVMDGWLRSPGHCRNLMNPGFVDLGVGMARSASGTLYWTQTFGRHR